MLSGASAALVRFGLRRTVITAVAVALEVVLALAVQENSPGRLAGISGAIGGGVAVLAGLLAGGRSGAITGATGSILFVWVGRNHGAGLVGHGIPVVALWTFLGGAAGAVTRRLRLRALVERDRLAALQEITERLSSALSEAEIAQVVVDVGLPAVGARAGSVYVATPDRLSLRLAATAGPAGSWPQTVSLSDPGPIADAIRRGRPLSFGPRYESITAPLTLGADVVGAIHFTNLPGRGFDPDLLALVDNVARQSAAALERARLYQRERDTSRTLQRSLLPGHLPDVPWLEVATVYRPQEAGLEVGGDFYDLVVLSDDACLAFIGDVSGKGVAAAAVTSQVRYTIRALARSLPSPAAILADLNGVLVASDLPPGLFCTVAVVRLDRDRAGVRATIACGGHPLPLLVRENGTVEEAGRPGQLIGALREVAIRDRTVALEPGDRLLLYTDGITEARRDGEMLGEDRLMALLEGAGSASPEQLASDVADLARRHADHSQDDAAIICIGLRGAG